MIASSLGNSPSPSAETVESNYADANSASPFKRVKSQVQQQQQQSDLNGLQQQQQQTPPFRREESSGNGFSFQSHSFDSVDHRLSLYFDLVLFGDDEEFVSVLCADVVKSGNPPASEGSSRECFVFDGFRMIMCV